jgi:hypothetical protein
MEKPCHCPDCGPISQWVDESLETETPIINVGLHKRSGITARRCSHPNAMTAKRKHGWNTKMVILASDVEQMRSQACASCVRARSPRLSREPIK